MILNLDTLNYKFKEDGSIDYITAGYNEYEGQERFNVQVQITQDKLPNPIENYNATQLDLQAKRIVREWTLETVEDVAPEEATETTE